MGRGFPDHLKALLDPRAYPHPVQNVEVIETHISWVLLTGEFAYKIKRPVHYPFIDLRSAQHRAFLCHEEVRLNRRFAPEIYLGVSPITSSDGEVRLQGPGQVVEHAVKMRQFQRADELDSLLANARIGPDELEAFGRELADIHADLPIARPTQAWGKPAAARALILENLQECARVADIFAGAANVLALRPKLEARLEAATPWMLSRFAGGRVRECHGDLHASNIVRWGSRLLAFDCMEFEAAFRWIDVADEIAFLLADLQSGDHLPHAQAFLGGYLGRSGDYQACRLLDLYQAHRCLVRAKVTALSATNAAGKSADEIAAPRRQFQAYLDCAGRSLSPRKPVLALMSGLSGSGKTWLARRLAPLMEAVHLRSDVERKRLAGLPELAKSGSAPEQGLYSREASDRLYQHLADCAMSTLAGGYTTIVDATFQRREDRTRFQDLAAQLVVPAYIVHCHAPQDVLQRRIAERRQRNDDASEADLSVLNWQETHHEPIEADEKFVVIEAGTAEADVVDKVIRRIRSPGT